MTPVTSIVDNDIIDLSRFVKFAERQRWVILSGLIVGTLLGLAFAIVGNSLTPSYASETTILLSGPKYKVQLEDKLLTNDKISDVQAAVRARETEYTSIAKSVEVRRATAARLGNLVTPEQVQAGSLPADVSVKVSGSLVTLSARSRDSRVVQQVAAEYANVVSKRLDEVYGQSEIDLANIQQQLQASMSREQGATDKVVANTRTSRLQELQTRLAQMQALRDTVANGINTSLANDLQSKTTALSLLDQLGQDTATLRDSIATSGSSIAARTAQANALYSLQTKLTTLSSSLSEQSPSVAPVVISNESALFPNTSTTPRAESRPSDGARTPIFPSTTTSQIRVQADALAAGTTQAQLLSDVDALKQIIEQRRLTMADSLRQTNDALLAQIKSGKGIGDDQNSSATLVTALNQDIQSLAAMIQSENQRIAGLQRDQQVASTTSDALSKKVAEITIDAGLTGGKAIIASGASEAARVEAPIPNYGVIGAVLGLVAGVAVAAYRDRRAERQERRGVTTAVAGI